MNTGGTPTAAPLSPARPSRVAELLTLPEAARRFGRPRRTIFRLLVGLHEKHGGDWLIRLGQRNYRVNISGLLAAHPWLKERTLASREEVELLSERVARIEREAHEHRRKTNAQGARLRQLELGFAAIG